MQSEQYIIILNILFTLQMHFVGFNSFKLWKCTVQATKDSVLLTVHGVHISGGRSVLVSVLVALKLTKFFN
jgi:hypothetical protein